MVQTRVLELLYVTDPSGQVRVFQLQQTRGALEGDGNNLLVEEPEFVHDFKGGGLLDMSKI